MKTPNFFSQEKSQCQSAMDGLHSREQDDGNGSDEAMETSFVVIPEEERHDDVESTERASEASQDSHKSFTLVSHASNDISTENYVATAPQACSGRKSPADSDKAILVMLGETYQQGFDDFRKQSSPTGQERGMKENDRFWYGSVQEELQNTGLLAGGATDVGLSPKERSYSYSCSIQDEILAMLETQRSHEGQRKSPSEGDMGHASNHTQMSQEGQANNPSQDDRNHPSNQTQRSREGQTNSPSKDDKDHALNRTHISQEGQANSLPKEDEDDLFNPTHSGSSSSDYAGAGDHVIEAQPVQEEKQAELQDEDESLPNRLSLVSGFESDFFGAKYDIFR